MEQYQIHIADAAEHNLRMMAHADRALNTSNLDDLRGHSREMRLHGEQIRYELNAALALVRDSQLKRRIEGVIHTISQAFDEAGCAMNEAEPSDLHRRATTIHMLGEQAQSLLDEAASLAGT